MQLVNRESSAVKDKQLLFPNMLSINSGKKRIIFKVKAIISQKKVFCFLGFFDAKIFPVFAPSKRPFSAEKKRIKRRPNGHTPKRTGGLFGWECHVF